MNIGFCVSHLFGGGAERVVTSLANTLSQLGHNVTVITTIRHEDDYSLNSNVRRCVLNEMNLSRWSLVNKCKRFGKLRNICKEYDIEVLIAFLGGAVSYSVLASIGLKTKVVASERNSPAFTYKSMPRRIWAKFIYSLSDGVVFQTNDAKEWFPRMVQRKSVVIPNPVKDVFYSTPYAPRLNEIISIGRLTEQKNFQLLIEAFDLVVGTVPNARLSIYGEGHLEKPLQRLIDGKGLSNHIKLKGRTYDVPKVLSEASVFVMSSDVEGMPNALMEAMTIGVPSVSTDCPCGGPRFLLSEERGLLSPVGDAAELAKKILILLEDEQLREAYSLRSKTYMMQFRQEIITAKWVDFISSLR